MTHVVTSACVDHKYQECVAVCPVEAFREADTYLIIDPDECIDCGACIPECPVDAIFADTDVPDEAFALVRDGDAEVFALPREQLLDYKEMLPGSRILTQGFGINDVGLAVAKGEPQVLEFMTKIIQGAKSSGLVNKILFDAELISRGFNVAK